MGVGAGIGAGGSLRVDPETLSHHGQQLVGAAQSLPQPPDPFTESGTDPLSQAINAMLPAIEDPIRELLPKVKEQAEKTANNIITAAGHYQRTDEQLASAYDAHRFDGTGTGAAESGGSGSGSGGGGSAASGSPAGGSQAAAGTASAGSGGGSDPMSQVSQMVGQAAQMPMQAMGALSSLPQSAMQGLQQISQMAGGDDKAENQTGQQDELDAEREKQDPEQGAAPGEANGERAPGVQSPTTTAVPQQSSGRHAAPDPTVNL